MKSFIKETTTCAESLVKTLEEVQHTPTKKILLDIREKTLSILGDVDYLLNKEYEKTH